MIVTKFFIKKVLGNVHTNLSIDGETVENLIKLFEQFNNLNGEQLLNCLPGELKKHAKYHVEKDFENDQVEVIYEYLMAEILELAGNCARDNYKGKISSYHIWMAILVDEELSTLFPKPKLPIFVGYNPTTLKSHGNYYRIHKKKVLQTLKDNNIKTSSDVFTIINHIINTSSNKYLNAEDIINKMKSFNQSVDNNKPLITQLHEIILNKLVDKLKGYQKKITFNMINEIVNSMEKELDYLFDK